MDPLNGAISSNLLEVGLKKCLDSWLKKRLRCCNMNASCFWDPHLVRLEASWTLPLWIWSRRLSILCGVNFGSLLVGKLSGSLDSSIPTELDTYDNADRWNDKWTKAVLEGCQKMWLSSLLLCLDANSQHFKTSEGCAVPTWFQFTCEAEVANPVLFPVWKDIWSTLKSLQYPYEVTLSMYCNCKSPDSSTALWWHRRHCGPGHAIEAFDLAMCAFPIFHSIDGWMEMKWWRSDWFA